MEMLDMVRFLTVAALIAMIGGAVASPVRYLVPDGVDPEGRRDDHDAIQSFINARAGQTIGLSGILTTASTIVIPTGTHIVCEASGIAGFRRLASGLAGKPQALVTIAADANNTSIENCLIDLNAPGSGNWWSGIQPLGSTQSIAIVGNTIRGATFTAINMTSAARAFHHKDLVIAKNHVSDTGWQGISAEAVSGLKLDDNDISQTGQSAIWLDDVHGFEVERNNVTKATPPSVIFSKSGPGKEGGFMIGLAPSVSNGVVKGNILSDNRRAKEDGIGLGENGTTCTNAVEVGTAPVSIRCATADQRAYAPGDEVSLFARAKPFETDFKGTVRSYKDKMLTVDLSSVQGAGTYGDLVLNTEPSAITITGNKVKFAGLFCIDHASGFTVTDNLCDTPATRGLNFDLDYGGRIRNVESRGNTVIDLTAGKDAHFAYFGSSAFTAFDNITLQNNQFVADGKSPKAYSNVGFRTDHAAFRNITVNATNRFAQVAGPSVFVQFDGSTAGVQDLWMPYVPAPAARTPSSVQSAAVRRGPSYAQILVQLAPPATPGGTVTIALPQGVDAHCKLQARTLGSSATTPIAVEADSPSTVTGALPVSIANHGPVVVSGTCPISKTGS